MRDKSFHKYVGRKLLPRNRYKRFFTGNIRQWLERNIHSRGSEEKERKWPELFGVGCWFIWKWRNMINHDQNFRKPFNEAEVVKLFLQDYYARWDGELNKEKVERIIMINWTPPSKGWCKLNTDGVSKIIKKDVRKAGCGGVIRGDCGEWLRGFAAKLGNCDAYSAECWGVIEGLKLCWCMGFKKIEVECDAAQVISDIEEGVQRRKDGVHQVIRELMRRDWQIKIKHVFRESNRCADRLAQMSLAISGEKAEWDAPPREVLEVLDFDRIGRGTPRSVVY